MLFNRDTAMTTTYRSLVIEPRKGLRLILKKFLEIDGHEVTLAADGLAGVELAASLKPDVVLTAIDLPGQDGFAVARQVREQLGAKPFVIATTSYSRGEIEVLMQTAGFSDYLPKPVSQSALRTILRKVDATLVG